MANPEIPRLEKNPEPCPVCDVTLTLGLLTGVCEGTKDPAKKNKCLEILRPLESGNKKAADALADAIVELGDDDVNSIVDRFNLLLYEATAKARDRLIEKGVLNRDGTPKVQI